MNITIEKFNELIFNFLTLTKHIKISSNAQCLYFQLLYEFSQQSWKIQLKIDNAKLYIKTNLSRVQFNNARNELIKLALIYYEKGKGSASGEYTIIDITKQYITDIIKSTKNFENKADINNLDHLIKQFEYLPDEQKTIAYIIIETLKNAIKNNTTGLYGTYATARDFVKCSLDTQIATVQKLIMTLMHKKDIKNKQAYILTTLANATK